MAVCEGFNGYSREVVQRLQKGQSIYKKELQMY